MHRGSFGGKCGATRIKGTWSLSQRSSWLVHLRDSYENPGEKSQVPGNINCDGAEETPNGDRTATCDNHFLSLVVL